MVRGGGGHGHLPVHKVEGVRPVGAQLLYLSPYSPDCNPIEQLWSKLKGYLRSVAARTTESLVQAIAQGLSQITLDDVRHWFIHYCYCA